MVLTCRSELLSWITVILFKYAKHFSRWIIWIICVSWMLSILLGLCWICSFTYSSEKKKINLSAQQPDAFMSNFSLSLQGETTWRSKKTFIKNKNKYINKLINKKKKKPPKKPHIWINISTQKSLKLQQNLNLNCKPGEHKINK